MIDALADTLYIAGAVALTIIGGYCLGATLCLAGEEPGASLVGAVGFLLCLFLAVWLYL